MQKENENSNYCLNYRRANLKNIPKEILDKKDFLIELDISGNNFDDFNSVLNTLKEFKKLKKLKINIFTQEQAKSVIDSMPNLEFLNDEPINDDSEEEEIDLNNINNEEEEIVKNISLIKINDDNFINVFKKLKDFFEANDNKANEFYKILDSFNNKCEQLKIKENKIKIEKLKNEDIKKELLLYKLIVIELKKIKEDMDNNIYNPKTANILLNIIEDNENIKKICKQTLDSRKEKSNNKSNNKQDINKKDNTIIKKENNKRNGNEWPNRTFNKNNDEERSKLLKDSFRQKDYNSLYSERRYKDNSEIKKYFKKEDLIKFYDDPKFSYLLKKDKSEFNTLNIFDDDNNDIILKEKLNTRTIKLSNLLEIINQVYKIRNNRIEKQKEGVYNKGTLEQDLYTYLKSKYGLKKLIIEWNINIISSIQTYYKSNGEVFLFALILRNELDEESIEILKKIKKTVHNILNIIYEYNIKKIENIKLNKEFINESEWKIISNYLYSDDKILKEKFINEISNYINKLVKGKDLIEKTGEKILYEDFMNILIIFILILRKKYLRNLFLSFSKEDKKRTGIINIDSFKTIIKNTNLIKDENKLQEVIDELIEIADKEGSGQITFNDMVQCLDNLDLITDEGTIKVLDRISN